MAGIAMTACSGTGQLEKGLSAGREVALGWCRNDPALRDVFPLPGSSVPGRMAGRAAAASNICCSDGGNQRHLWQLEVSRWPTARRLSQGLHVFLEEQIVPSQVR